jgi:hypothetical protein
VAVSDLPSLDIVRLKVATWAPPEVVVNEAVDPETDPAIE